MTPIDAHAFDHLYRDVDPSHRQSLREFRSRYLPKEITYNGNSIRYVALGQGQTGALFLPGAVGFHDIWWQQLMALEGDLRLISLSYPPIDNLEDMRNVLNAILEEENLGPIHVIGTSMGGYLAQYLLKEQPESIARAVLASTFVPFMPVLRITPLLRLAIFLLPIGALMFIFRFVTRFWLLPSIRHDPLLRAYFNEFSHAGLTKDDLRARVSLSNQPFQISGTKNLDIPILIIQSEDDPIIRPEIQRALREMYPQAQCVIYPQGGHFFLNRSESLTALLREFLLAR